MADRAILFIDGNNWYHSLKSQGLTNLMQLDYAKISKKLVGPRQWVATRYYIGALKLHHRDYAAQRRFLSLLENDDDRISVRRGRIEDRPVENELSFRLSDYVRRTSGLGWQVKQDLIDLANEHKLVSQLKEKATDVLLAVDMCEMAIDDQLDAAYLLSADGDYTPAVELVQARGKKVYAGSPADCAALRHSAHAYIPLRAAWFTDCYR